MFNRMILDEKKVEPEHRGSKWKHPYVVYIWATLLLFALLVIVATICYRLGVIPNV